MKKLQISTSFILGLVFFTAASFTGANPLHFGPFFIDDRHPGLIVLDGEIDVNSALNFRRAIQAAPSAKLLVLNSPGGNVQMSLLIADDANQHRMATYIPKSAGCYSACAYIFLAGIDRHVDGELGVHQISSESPDIVGAQVAISDIIDVLGRYNTSPGILSVMFKTPPNEMHVFTQYEIEQLELNRAGYITDGPSAKEMASLSSGVTLNGNGTKISKNANASPQTKEALPSSDRIAVYTGLDLFGDDINAIRAATAGDCAAECASMRGQCKAFTFNTNPKIKRGPNCFLKAGYGRLDGNSVAFSGLFLSQSEKDPEPFTIETIDPQQALFEGVDIPGGDLSRHPYAAATSPLQCRLACIDNDRCLAFTYVRSKNECWLKGTIGTSKARAGLVSGIKRQQNFVPAKVINLN